MNQEVKREAVRAVVMDEAGRVLLARFDRKDIGKQWWAPVGGGLRTDEDPLEGLRREVREETGLEEFQIGPLLWSRQARFEWQGRPYLQQEQVFLVRVAAFEPSLAGMEEGEKDLVDEVRWWSIEEVEESAEVMSPLDLGQLLRAVEKGQTGLELREVGD